MFVACADTKDVCLEIIHWGVRSLDVGLSRVDVGFDNRDSEIYFLLVTDFAPSQGARGPDVCSMSARISNLIFA